MPLHTLIPRAGMLITLCVFSSSPLLANDFSIEPASSKISEIDGGFTKQIQITKQLISADVGSRVSFRISDSQTVEFVIDNVTTGYQGSKTLSANAPAGEHLLLTMNDAASYGTIQGNGLNLNISHDKALGQILVDQNNTAFPTIDLGDDGLIPPGMSPNIPGYLQSPQRQSADQQGPTLEAATSGKSTVTLLVLYSSEFANGFASPTGRINQLISFTNQALERSGVDIELKLARTQVHSFNNGDSISNLLRQITDGTGSFASVNSIRNQYKADLVALLPFKDNNASSGVAWVNGDDPRFAYSVTQLSPRCCDSVFAHELGHNLGSGHERQSANPRQNSPCDFNFTGYSCGHGNASRNWGTIMSYLNSGRVNHVFSNPSLDCLGEPCGIPEGRSNEADNEQSFNISRSLVANFRIGGDEVIPPVAPPQPPRNSDTTLMPVVDLLLSEEKAQ